MNLRESMRELDELSRRRLRKVCGLRQAVGRSGSERRVFVLRGTETEKIA
jgi:hypothetical protein